MSFRCSFFCVPLPLMNDNAMNRMKEHPADSRHHGGFHLREYGRAELAALYCPNIAPVSAWRKLKKWIDRHPELPDRLAATGYNNHARGFTPAQVQLIVDALGEP